MSCEICGRGSCTRSFHSLAEQADYELKQEMSDDVDDLRDEILDLRSRVKFLERQVKTNEEVIEERKLQIAELEREREELKSFLDYVGTPKEAKDIQRAAYERCAQIAEEYVGDFEYEGGIGIAAAIRAEMEKGGNK